MSEDDDKLSPSEAALLGVMAVNEDGSPVAKDFIAKAGTPLVDETVCADREQIIEALKQTGYNKSRAAQLLGIDRKTLYNKLKLYGIEL